MVNSGNILFFNADEISLVHSSLQEPDHSRWRGTCLRHAALSLLTMMLRVAEDAKVLEKRC